MTNFNMKIIFRFFKRFILFIVIIFVLLPIYLILYAKIKSEYNLNKLGGDVKIIVSHGEKFRDLNKNDLVDIYENYHCDINERVEDLLAKLSLSEKVGLMFMSHIQLELDGSLSEIPKFDNIYTWFYNGNSELIINKKMNNFMINLSGKTYTPYNIAKWHNEIQKLAEKTRLGIPITLSTNAMHQAVDFIKLTTYMNSFSHWPYPLGLAATRDTSLVEDFANIARQEYMATGIRLAVHPLADLSTDPRWSRTINTFGEDADLTSAMVRAYVRGFQGIRLSSESVACMTKHFAGAGPHSNGEDSHFPYGKNLVYPGNNFRYHLKPFVDGAFIAHTAQIMPYYSIPKGQTKYNLGFAFNKDIITNMLRKKYKFNGVVCTDWNLISQYKFLNFIPIGFPKSWGVEGKSESERLQLVIEAGCDQFGGEFCPELLIDLVQNKTISENRIDQSVRRILHDKFALGLFEKPFVNLYQVNKIVGKDSFVRKGKIAQRKSIVLLKNGIIGKSKMLPVRKKMNVYIENIDKYVVEKYAKVVSKPHQADFIIIRLMAPFEKRYQFAQEAFYHMGKLSYKKREEERILNLIKQKPSVIAIFLDRPAVIPKIAAQTTALLADFGVTDEALLDVIFGKFTPTGKLPVELPASDEAVVLQKEDMPCDSKNPLFEFGYGLTY